MPKSTCSNYQSKGKKLNQLEAPQSKRKARNSKWEFLIETQSDQAPEEALKFQISKNIISDNK